MATWRFLHLSDIHFGQERGGDYVEHEGIRTDLLADAAAMREALGPATNLIVVGDVAFSGTKPEYETAQTWLDKLAAAAGCDRTAVLVIPGNHDVDRTEVKTDVQMMHEVLRGCTPAEAHTKLAKLAGQFPEDHPLFRKLTQYVDFASQYGCQFGSTLRPAWERDILLDGNNRLRLLGLASVHVCDAEDAEGNLLLGNSQYIFDRTPGVEWMVMCHHPLTWFMDKDSAGQFITTRARVFVTGHEHKGKLYKQLGEDDHECLFICSGAATPPSDDAEYVFTYNWVECELTDRILSFRVYPRVWSSARTKFVPDRNRMDLDAAGAKAFSVPFSQYHAAPAASAAKTPPSLGDPIMTATHSDHVAANIASGFDALQFYFWRYLDWRTRLKVLVDLDLLPHVAERPLPQTLEQIALREALAGGPEKLSKLWESTMGHVPADQRASNPFEKPH